jgi:glycosyltransferase involved in cell wall biosynthesis
MTKLSQAQEPLSGASRPVRVAHLNSMLTGGGTDDQCVKLAHNLMRLGHEVRLAGPDGREFSKIARDLGIPFHPTPSGAFAKLRFILGAARLIKFERLQIVHGHHGRDLWPTILAARLSRTRPRIVLSRHLAKSPSSWASRRFLLGQCDAMIAVSAFVAKVLREGAYEPDSPELERRSRPPLSGDHSKVEVIHGGIDTARFHPFDAAVQRAGWKLEPRHFAFGVVGGYDLPRGKGQREFLKAAAMIHEKVPDARFLIIGRGNMKEILEKDIIALKLGAKASLTAWCRDMPAAMNAIDCLVHPQVGTEAFPGVVVEAFACGRPVIASHLDGIPEAFAAGNTGQLITPEAVPDLAEAMLAQMNRPRPTEMDRKKLHAAIATGFSLEVTAKKTAELYRKLIEEK